MTNLAYKKQEMQIEDQLGDEDITVPLKYDITSYGANYTVDSLVKRINSKAIYIPSFQRGFVWKQKEASSFIESLLLGLPVPGIFLARDEETQRLSVIDGQQRLKTLQFFYEGIFDNNSIFILKGVQSEFLDKSYKSLGEADRIRLDDSIIHATIIKQESPQDDNSSVFHIFERINNGGIKLAPQEIRTSIYNGLLSETLNELNENMDWRSLYGPIDKTMKDRELILRYLALNYHANTYYRPMKDLMKDFLNRYISRNRSLQLQDKTQIQSDFSETVKIVNQILGAKAFKPKKAFNAAVFDSIMVGVSKRLKKGRIHDDESLRKAYKNLMSDEEFIKFTSRGTASNEAVKGRLNKAITAFENVV